MQRCLLALDVLIASYSTGSSTRARLHQRALRVIHTRDALVASRVKLVNHVRGSLKSLGIFPPSGCSTEAFARKATAALTQEDYALVAPALEMIAALSERIAEDKRIDAMIEEDYPAAQKLMTIPGVGPITHWPCLNYRQSGSRTEPEM